MCVRLMTRSAPTLCAHRAYLTRRMFIAQAWAMVKRLQDEIKIMQAEQTGGVSIEALLGSWRNGAGSMATGQLLTHHIPVVVATGEVTLATVAADAGDEDSAVRRVTFDAHNLGFDVAVAAFGEPLAVARVDPGGPAAAQGVEVGDLLIDANGLPIPTDRPEAELRRLFAGFTRPVTLGFYKLRKATEQARRASMDVRGGQVRGVAVRHRFSLSPLFPCGDTCPVSHTRVIETRLFHAPSSLQAWPKARPPPITHLFSSHVPVLHCVAFVRRALFACVRVLRCP